MLSLSLLGDFPCGLHAITRHTNRFYHVARTVADFWYFFHNIFLRILQLPGAYDPVPNLEKRHHAR
jgi:hypothetical protein